MLKLRVRYNKALLPIAIASRCRAKHSSLGNLQLSLHAVLTAVFMLQRLFWIATASRMKFRKLTAISSPRFKSCISTELKDAAATMGGSQKRQEVVSPQDYTLAGLAYCPLKQTTALQVLPRRHRTAQNS